jgi:tight adherence protein C
MSATTLLALAALLAAGIGGGLGRRPPPRPVASDRPVVASSAGTGRNRRSHLVRDRRIRLGLAVGASIGTAVVAPMLPLAIGAVVAGVGLTRRRRAGRVRDARVFDRLAEVIDLYAVALFSGHNVANATRHVARWAPDEFGSWLGWCVDQADHGRALSDALEDLPQRIGPPVRPLVAALVANDRYGAPITESLGMLAADVRSERRRRAETAARRLPVVMLFPLVLCVLPAFLLLTVVPIVIDTVVSFEL